MRLQAQGLAHSSCLSMDENRVGEEEENGGAARPPPELWRGPGSRSVLRTARGGASGEVETRLVFWERRGPRPRGRGHLRLGCRLVGGLAG